MRNSKAILAFILFVLAVAWTKFHFQTSSQIAVPSKPPRRVGIEAGRMKAPTKIRPGVALLPQEQEAATVPRVTAPLFSKPSGQPLPGLENEMAVKAKFESAKSSPALEAENEKFQDLARQRARASIHSEKEASARLAELRDCVQQAAKAPPELVARIQASCQDLEHAIRERFPNARASN